MQKLDISRLGIIADKAEMALPDWASSAIEIGAWARFAAESCSGRLLVFCVVPCRATFSAFVNFGAVAAGGCLFRKGFSWNDFLNLGPGTEIFWSAPGFKQKFSGVIQPHEEVCGATLVPVLVTKGPQKWKGNRWSFSESKFLECIFSEEKLPSAIASEKFEQAERFYKKLGTVADSAWLVTAGAEIRMISSATGFRRNLEGWELSLPESGCSASIGDVLVIKDETDSSLAKTRITGVRGTIGHDCPVTVFDGPLAYDRFSEINAGSLVFVLERSELREEHIDLLIQANHEHSSEHDALVLPLKPEDIPDCVEMWAACLQ